MRQRVRQLGAFDCIRFAQKANSNMLVQLGQVARGHPVWLRLNPGFGHGHNRKTNTGGPSGKHGIWHEELEQALHLIDAHRLSLVGLHMHIGSGVQPSTTATGTTKSPLRAS
jgi:diaminopimelate decarboxylase